MAAKKKASTKTVTEKTKADVLWSKIKSLPLNLFGLPNQTVEDHVKKVDVGDPDAVFLNLKATGVLPVLEETLKQVKVGKNEMIDVSIVDQYTVIKVIPKFGTPNFVNKLG